MRFVVRTYTGARLTFDTWGAYLTWRALAPVQRHTIATLGSASSAGRVARPGADLQRPPANITVVPA